MEVKFHNSLHGIDDVIDYRRMHRIYEASECFLEDFPEYERHERLFKIFFITPATMRIISI